MNHNDKLTQADIDRAETVWRETKDLFYRLDDRGLAGCLVAFVLSDNNPTVMSFSGNSGRGEKLNQEWAHAIQALVSGAIKEGTIAFHYIDLNDVADS